MSTSGGILDTWAGNGHQILDFSSWMVPARSADPGRGALAVRGSRAVHQMRAMRGWGLARHFMNRVLGFISQPKPIILLLSVTIIISSDSVSIMDASQLHVCCKVLI